MPTTLKKAGEARNDFLEIIELFNPGELAMVRKHGGALLQPTVSRQDKLYWGTHKPRIMLEESKRPAQSDIESLGIKASLPAVYDNVSEDSVCCLLPEDGDVGGCI
jgi:hypothetical protein